MKIEKILLLIVTTVLFAGTCKAQDFIGRTSVTKGGEHQYYIYSLKHKLFDLGTTVEDIKDEYGNGKWDDEDYAMRYKVRGGSDKFFALPLTGQLKFEFVKRDKLYFLEEVVVDRIHMSFKTPHEGKRWNWNVWNAFKQHFVTMNGFTVIDESTGSKSEHFVLMKKGTTNVKIVIRQLYEGIVDGDFDGKETYTTVEIFETKF